jgi:hypothetical protein
MTTVLIVNPWFGTIASLFVTHATFIVAGQDVSLYPAY